MLSPTFVPVVSAFRSISIVNEFVSSVAGKHLLLTGSTGFFGRWLLALLYELNLRGAGVEVTAVSRDPARFLVLHPEYSECTWLRWIASDTCNLYSVPGRSIDFILHMATDTSAVAHARPLELFDNIVGGARRVFDLAVQHDVGRVLVTGSGAQYGNVSVCTKVDENYSGACRSNIKNSAYGEAKRVQEMLAALYADKYGLSVVMARCFSFSGPGLPLNGHFAIGNFVRDALYRPAIQLQSDGKTVRSYLYGADLAVWLLKLLLDGEVGDIYNIGSDQGISIADLAKKVCDRIAPYKEVLLGTAPLGGGGGSFYVPDISKARSLGLDVWTQLDDSIDAMAIWAKFQSGAHEHGC